MDCPSWLSSTGFLYCLENGEWRKVVMKDTAFCESAGSLSGALV